MMRVEICPDVTFSFTNVMTSLNLLDQIEFDQTNAKIWLENVS